MPTYLVEGTSQKTGRKLAPRSYWGVDEAAAIAEAERAGLVVEHIVANDPEPPTERQLAYAQDLGITVPPGATFDEVSDLIDARLADDRNPPSVDDLEIARSLNIQYSRYTGKLELHNRIFAFLGKKGDANKLLQWFVYQVYRDLAGRTKLGGTPKRWDDPVLAKIAAELADDPQVVKSVSQYAGQDLCQFGSHTLPGGEVAEGGSRRTIAYKRTAELLKKRVPGLFKPAAGGANKPTPGQVSSEQSGCLGVVLLAAVLPVGLALLWL